MGVASAKTIEPGENDASVSGKNFQEKAEDSMAFRVKELLMGGPGAATRTGDVGLLVLRVVAGGLMFYLHGLGKVPPQGKFVDGVTALGFPAPTLFAWAAALSEAVGGVLLVLGLFTRPAALMLAFTMGVAAFLVHGADPLAKKELALVYLSIALLYLLAGAGRYSLDAVIRRK